jgi:hypothetical protein
MGGEGVSYSVVGIDNFDEFYIRIPVEPPWEVSEHQRSRKL